MLPLRVVLDANVIISALIRPNSAPGRILRAVVEATAVRMVTSDPLLEELRAAIEYPRLQRYLKMSKQDKEEFVILLEQIADPVNTGDCQTPGICRDPKDEPYLQTALAGRADYIVSGDGDLLNLEAVEHIPIVLPADFGLAGKALSSQRTPKRFARRNCDKTAYLSAIRVTHLFQDGPGGRVHATGDKKSPSLRIPSPGRGSH